MNTTKHTPGPWKVCTPSATYPWERFTIMGQAHPDNFSESGYLLHGRPVTVARIQAEPSKITTEANAKLIAAAPDLLAALGELLRHCVTPSGFPDKGKGRTDVQQRAYDNARAAITKATE